MKTSILTGIFAAAIGFIALPSCSYVECLTAENTEECAIGKSMEAAVSYLAGANDVDSEAKAEEFASKWEKTQMTIATAQKLGVKIPDNLKKAYNDTLARIQKHNYFNSPHLKTAMANAEYIK